MLTTLPVRAAEESTLLVFAAASTRDAVTEILEGYNKSHDIKAVGVFAGSATLARQIAQKAPAAIYISANSDWMDSLEREGLILPASRIDLLTNTLVVIVPLECKAQVNWDHIEILEDILDGGRLALADPSAAPAGAYARQALEHAGLWDEAAASVIFASDVRAALAWVDRGEAAAAVVYGTDAALSPRVRVLAKIPNAAHDRIRYPAAVIRGDQEVEGVELLEFLKGPEAAAIFARYGFQRSGPDS